ncbi:MAG: hypothetical protein M0Z28_06750 [Rhodospirillales bacterium]|nr:hypothetical protein [Rhodospirillales bacterium]
MSEFTSKWCAPVGSRWADDTHAMAHVARTPPAAAAFLPMVPACAA